MTPLHHEGSERFDAYMHRCLYGPDGFYRSGRGVAGRRGDFITSPEVGPLFAAVLARWLDAVWEHRGRPDPFLVIDAGTGPATLLTGLKRAAPACAATWRLLGVDPAQGTVLPERLDGAVVIANELLDNLVFRIIEHRPDGYHEVTVDTGQETLVPLAPAERRRLPPPLAQLAAGSRAPWLEAANAWVGEVLDRGAAHLLVLDYGAATTAELVARGGWLRTYRGHVRGSDPYHEPGQWDITTDVAFDQLVPPRQLESQAEFLHRFGLEELVEAGRQYWAAHAARPDLTAMMMRSRVVEAEALTDPDGLGAWLVAHWGAPVGVR